MPLRLKHTPQAYALACLACATTTAVAMPLIGILDLANIVMLFLLTVVLIAVWLGRGPAVASAFLAVAMFDFFFVPPRFSFTVSDAQYLLTFAVMLAVALITAHLTARLKEQARTANENERRIRALYELARELAGAFTRVQAIEIVERFARATAGGEIDVMIEAEDGTLVPASDARRIPGIDMRMAELARSDGACVDFDAQPVVGYFPLTTANRVRGVLAAAFPGTAGSGALQAHRELLEAVASFVAIVVERLHYVDVANRADVRAQSERLRSSILSALSHDIRTPLTALTGLADSLARSRIALPAGQQATAAALRDQAMRVNGLVENLLDMARLNAGEVTLRKEWQPLEEVVGSSLKLLERSLGGHAVDVRLPDDLPLVEIDAILMERVLCNLVENAAKYSPAGAPIEIAARDIGAFIEVEVRDHGPGVAGDREERIFEMFVRGERESAQPGVGLGLAICRAIAEAHGGTVRAENHPDGGARFIVRLPRGEPPGFTEEPVARVAET